MHASPLRAKLSRTLHCSLLLFMLWAGAGASAIAEESHVTVILHAGQSTDDIDRVLKSAAATGKDVIVQWEDGAGTPAPATATAKSSPPAAAKPADPAPAASGGAIYLDSASSLLSAFTDGLKLGLSGISGISSLFEAVGQKLTAQGQSWLSVSGLCFGAAFVAALCGWLAYRATRGIITRHTVFHDDIISRIRGASLQFAADLLGLLVFFAVGELILHLVTEAGTLAYQFTSLTIIIIAVATLYAIFARLLFAPDNSVVRLIRVNHPSWHWHMLFAYGAISALMAQSVVFARANGLDTLATEGWFLVGVTILTVLKIAWFIGGRRDIAHAFAGEMPGVLRRAMASLLPEFYTLSALAIWVASCLIAGKPQSTTWTFAAGATQVIILLLPVVALGAHAVIQAAIHRRQRSAELPPLQMAAALAMQTVLTGAVWLTGLHAIIALWRPIMSSGGAAAMIAMMVLLERISLALVVSWTIWSFLRHYFEAVAPTGHLHMPGDADAEEEPVGNGRLSTILPVVRNLAFGAILAITALVVLSSLGLDTGPLLAGFGVLGLALSFGSQTLVKDIVSGIFFIADDAFRLGEYLDTGKLKGTVERISLRSIRLRHQNGPIHTIPFGQLQAVTNYSRDWSTIKFELRFDRDADPEQIRKVVKKVGLSMLEDPEFGSEFLVPLKMQGIQDITDNSLVIRLKFTAKPGNPSLIQREAIKRLLPAFKQAGLLLASNAVTVRSNASDIASNGAAIAAIDRATAEAEAKAAEAEAEAG